MRILLLDDDAVKRSRVEAAFLEVPGIAAHDTDCVGDLASARHMLEMRRYDLLVVDVVVPEIAGQELHRDGGLQLIRELVRERRYMVPSSIVAMTGFADIQHRLADEFRETSVVLVHYSDGDLGWKRSIQAAIVHRLRVFEEAARLPDRDRCLAVVICALREPELESVRRVPWSWQRESVAGDVGACWRGFVSSGDQRHSVIATHADEMGPAASAALTAKMIEVFRPRLVAMVGIAAGIPTAVSIGTVLVADPTWDYSAGRISSHGDDWRFDPAPRQTGVSPVLRALLHDMAEDSEALARVRASWLGAAPAGPVRVAIGPVASGPVVIAHDAARQFIKGQHRKLLGVDMETHAVYCAASQARSPQPLFVSMKAVSDFAGADKGDGDRAFAAHCSARVFREFIEGHFLPWICGPG